MTSNKSIDGKTVARLAAGGFAAGVVNGIFGNGGGVVIVFLLGSAGALFPEKRDIFANVTAAVLPIALTSALIYSSVSPPMMSDVIAVGAASLAGGIIGAVILGKVNARLLKMLFASLMIISGILMLARVK